LYNVRLAATAQREYGAQPVTTQEALNEILQILPMNRLDEVLDFARFLSEQDEREAWRKFGRSQLARAYGPDEPEYDLDDIKPELNE
jgi:uncharacterized protein YaeQ